MSSDEIPFAVQEKFVCACQSGDLHTVKALIDDGFPVDYTFWDPSTLVAVSVSVNLANKTPLMIAAAAGEKAIAAYLISKSADVNFATNRTRETALMFARGDVEMLKLLLSARADPNARSYGVFPPTVLCIACRDWGIAAVKELVKAGAYINSGTTFGIACESGNQDIVEYLINQGAYVNPRNLEGDTPLHLCAKQDHVHVIRTLVNAGANVEATNNTGATAFWVACHSAKEQAALALLQYGARWDVCPTDSWDDPFSLAMSHRMKRVVIELIRAGHDRALAMLRACEKGDDETAAFLLDGGYDPDTRFHDQSTALHVAFQYNYVKIGTLLLAAGANVDAKNKYGKSPVDVARKHKHTDVIALSEAHRANVALARVHRQTRPAP